MTDNPFIHTKELEPKKLLAYDETIKCVQCGYCLPVCPTYETMGKETHSPRGRINLVKMTAEGRLNNLDLLADTLDKCLGCRACETACPVGVEYGKIYESAKVFLNQRKHARSPAGSLKTALLKYLFPNKKLLSLLGNSVWFYQKSGLQKIARVTGITRRLPNHLGEFEALLPTLPSPSLRRQRPTQYRLQGKQVKFRVAFFTGCIMDAVYEKVNRLGMQLLHKVGCEVIILKGETCCGALHAHSDELEMAKELAKQNIIAYEKASEPRTVDFIVNTAGGCGAMLHEYTNLFADDLEWEARAKEFVAKTRDISQVLYAAGPLPFINDKIDKSVSLGVITYQRSCHMTNVQKVTKEPVELIRSIPGYELREMEDRDKCCGSAGIYNIEHYDESMEILDVKMTHVKNTNAHTIVATNPGCLLQMQMGIHREGLQEKVRAVHLVELLAEACGLETH